MRENKDLMAEKHATSTKSALPPLGQLHGKLATYELCAKAKQIENAMTAEEKLEVCYVVFAFLST